MSLLYNCTHSDYFLYVAHRHPGLGAFHPLDNAVVLFLPIFHVYGVLVLISQFCRGKTTVLMDHFDFEHYLHLVQKYKVKQFTETITIVFNTFDSEV